MLPFASPSRASPLAAGATIPLAFIAAGLATATLATGWLALAPGLLALPHLHLDVVALAHVWLVGALLSVCFGAVYQLLPVLANTAFTGRRLAFAHLAIHTAGALALVLGFSLGRLGLVALGGSAVTLGVFFFALNVARTLRAASRLDPILVAFAAATAWLVSTVLAGLILALQLRFGSWSLDVLAFLRTHAHLGIVGFFVTLIQGAMFRLVPMFTLAEVKNLRPIGVALSLSQLGLLALAPGLAWHATAAELAGAALLIVSFALSGLELRRILATRKKRRYEPGLRAFFTGLAFLAACALVGPVLVLAPLHLPSALAYGVAAVLGGVLLCVEGMLCKIVPFLVWMRVYGPRVGRQPTPVAATLGHAASERLWLRLHVIAVILLAAGTATERPLLLVPGAFVFAAGQVALLVSLGRTAAHLVRPLTPAAPLPAFAKSTP